MKVGIGGIKGRLGQAIVKAVENDPSAIFSFGTTSLEEVAVKPFDVFIDLTTPNALTRHLDLCLSECRPIVIGTTGLDVNAHASIAEAAKLIPVLYASNLSLGVSLMSHAVQQAAATLKTGWDIDISDVHRRGKKDAPSGTALTIAKHLAEILDWPYPACLKTSMDGPRQDESIYISVKRVGQASGAHTVTFTSDHEVLSFSHQSFDRQAYAQGALRAAHWLLSKKPGLYGMDDVLSSPSIRAHEKVC